jgi:hypothetical protein
VSARHRPPHHLRLVVPVSEPDDLIAPVPVGPAGPLIDRYLAPFITAGRQIILAAVAAIVDEAVAHGVEDAFGDTAGLRDDLAEIVGRNLEKWIAERIIEHSDTRELVTADAVAEKSILADHAMSERVADEGVTPALLGRLPVDAGALSPIIDSEAKVAC